jgi:hypothetical protein
MKTAKPIGGTKMYRQGDVGIFPVASIPAAAKKQDSKHVVLALGEVTGHSHQFAVGAAVVDFRDEVDRFIEVLEESVLKHEEHAPITLPAGNYKIKIQREYEPDGWRYVED